MSGHVFDPVTGQHSWTHGGRTVATTLGTLFNFLPLGSDYVNTISVAFPDFSKSYWYSHWWVSDWNSLANAYGMDEGSSTQITALPQEWSATTVLMAAPAGADIFASRVRINRTASPSHAWGGNAIDVLPKVNEWIPFFGSVMVEAEIGMARAFSLYIDGGNLVLHRQQSVSTPPGGFAAYGNSAPLAHADASGGAHTYGSAPGIPVCPRDTRNIAGYTETAVYPFAPDKPVSCAPGGANACATSDITNYASTYSVEIVGKFGRRS